MKQVLFTVIGSFLLFTGSIASGNNANKHIAAIVKPALAPQCNFAFTRGHRKGNGASIAWGMDGAGAAKFYVARTYDFDPTDPYAVWEDVATVSSNSSRSNKLDDNSVFPGTIHYRIVAVMTDGSSVTSELIQVQIRKK